MAFSPWLSAALLLVLGGVLVGRRIVRRRVTGEPPLSLGQLAVLMLGGGAALSVLAFFAIVGVGGPEMRGGDAATGRVITTILVLGLIVFVLGIVLGIVVLARRGTRTP